MRTNIRRISSNLFSGACLLFFCSGLGVFQFNWFSWIDIGSQSSALAAEPVGDIVTASGSVKARGSKNGSSRDLVSGGKVHLQDVINTGSDGRVKILLKDKTILDIGPSSLFEIEKFSAKKNQDGTEQQRQVQVSLPYGKLRTAVTQKLKGDGQFKVRTATATMGVRGTEFVVKSEAASENSNTAPPQTEITVLSGEVALDQKSDSGRDPASSASNAGGQGATGGNFPTDGGATMTLTAGTQVSVGGERNTSGPGNSSEPTKVSETEMREVASESTVKDSSFSEKVTISDTATQEKKETASAEGAPAKGEDGRAPSSEGSSESSNESPSSGGDAFSALNTLVADAPLVVDIPLSTLDIPGTFDLAEDSSESSTTDSSVGSSARISITIQ